MNVLLIEDHETDRKLLSAVLHASGNRVVERVSAEEAFEAIGAEQPDVILIDLKLPGMDGLELTRRLRASHDTRDIRVVAVTAAPDLYSRQDALRAGCDAYIVKPVDTRKFSDQVTRDIDVLRKPGR